MMDAPAAQPQSTVTVESRTPLRELFAAAVETLRTRVELAATDLEIHLLALVRMLVWAVGAIICVLLAFAFAVTALVVSLWDTHRMLGLLGGCGFFVVLAALCGWLGARAVRGSGGLLEGTLHQLREDQRHAGGMP